MTGGVENDCCRPAVIFIAVRQIGPGILIDANGQVSFMEESEDFRIAIGGDIHDMAPVTPDGFEIEQDEAVVASCLREDGVGPGEPSGR